LSATLLLETQAAVDQDFRAYRELRFVGREEDDGCRDFAGISEAALRHHSLDRVGDRFQVIAFEAELVVERAVVAGENDDRAFVEAREQLPDLRRHFFGQPAAEFVPFNKL